MSVSSLDVFSARRGERVRWALGRSHRTDGDASCPTGFENASYSKTCGERTISGGVERPDCTTELAGSPDPFDSCLETSSQYTSPYRPSTTGSEPVRTTRWHDAHSMRGGTVGGQRGDGIARRFGIMWSAGTCSSSPGANHAVAGERWTAPAHR